MGGYIIVHFFLLDKKNNRTTVKIAKSCSNGHISKKN